jgi:hypothetical protein
MTFFFFYEIRGQEGRIGPIWGIDTSRREEEVGNVVQICVHIYANEKVTSSETIPGLG